MSGADPQTTQWNPTPILDERLLREQRDRFSLVILNQPIHNIPLFLDLWKRATVRIAADGGANRVRAIRADLPPAGPPLDFIVGDLDSLRSETRAWFLQQPGLGPAGRQQQIIEIEDQDSTDFAKAVKHARELSQKRARGRPSAGSSHDQVEDIICYSGLGGRVDQAMSQLHHLYMFQQRRGPSDVTSNESAETEARERPENGDGHASGRMYLTNGESLTFVLLAGRHAIRIRDKLDVHEDAPIPTNIKAEEASRPESKPNVFGKHVGIIPLAGPSLLTTRGLEWDVRDWRTEFGGRMSTSNHTTPGSDVVEVETSRDVLFTIDIPVLV
ncbi:hypothetical protein DL764_010793 [Monosporascus ibericus]|uniref:Thiamine pyrophosphokinase n=1 Tax=Monosporascus ibericus TaxID=155417 RepID=A0A4Q4STJ0_9PEZI|nr:hypothetical protein DL764_010793 [Monosporascus ibericus]